MEINCVIMKLKKEEKLLKTERLVLRAISDSDREAIFEYRSDKVSNQFQGWIPERIEDVSAFIAKVSPIYNSPNSWFQFVILENSTNQIIGDLGVHFLEEGSRQAEIGCTINKEFQSQGYATEALNAVINSLFKELNFHRVFASIDPRNIASQKMMEKLGFRKEALFKESLFLNGNWVDDMMYAILQKEWKK